MIKVAKENGNFVVTETTSKVTIHYPWIVFTMDEHSFKYPHEVEGVFRSFYYPEKPLDDSVTVEFTDDAKILVEKICEINCLRD